MGKTIHNRKHFDDDSEDDSMSIQNRREEDIQRRKRKGYKEKTWFEDAMKREDERNELLDRAIPMTGFFNTLTPEQQKQALSYTGPENIGPPGSKRTN